ncbi:MAG: Trm112 family protein [Candidatus Muiribacteriota bacterium]
MINKELLKILACPLCGGELCFISKPREGLFCRECEKLYLIKNKIPVMLPDESIDCKGEGKNV